MLMEIITALNVRFSNVCVALFPSMMDKYLDKFLQFMLESLMCWWLKV